MSKKFSFYIVPKGDSAVIVDNMPDAEAALKEFASRVSSDADKYFTALAEDEYNQRQNSAAEVVPDLDAEMGVMSERKAIEKTPEYTVYEYSDEPWDIAIEGKHTRVSWVYIDEGWFGDYNEENPDDEPLLRFDVDARGDDTHGEWYEPSDSSYCTCTPATTDRATLVRLLKILYREFSDVLDSDPFASVKRLGERMSYINPRDLAS